VLPSVSVCTQRPHDPVRAVVDRSLADAQVREQVQGSQVQLLQNALSGSEGERQRHQRRLDEQEVRLARLRALCQLARVPARPSRDVDVSATAVHRR
jgi:hypothetical protein